jgi:hypothetical protein
MESIIIIYSHTDEFIARLIYFHLVKELRPNWEVFIDDYSVNPSENFHSKCISAAIKSKIGLIILSQNTYESEYASQEIGMLIGKNIPRLYLAVHKECNIPQGYDKNIISFPLYSGNPYDNLNKLTMIIKNMLNTNRSDCVDSLTPSV